jgi:hypothetical protein
MEKTWTLTEGSGPKKVYVQIIDKAGNISLALFDGITLQIISFPFFEEPILGMTVCIMREHEYNRIYL